MRVMALYRQGSGCKKHGSNSNSNSSTNNSKRRLRGFFFSNLSIFQCAVLVFAFIILTVFFLLFSSSLPRGDYQILRRNDNYDHERFSDLHNRKPNENGDMLDDTDWEELNKGGRGNSKLNDKGNVVRKKSKVLHFGQNSYGSGRDSRDWDRDDRRRDDEYGIDDPAFLDKVSSIDQEVSVLESGDGYKKSSVFSEHGKIERERDRVSKNAAGKKSVVVNESGAFKRKAVNQKRQYDELYNEKGRDELKLYEEQYKSSLEHKISEIGVHKEEQSDLEDEYDDGIDEDYVQSADEEGTVTQNSVLGILEKQTGDNSSFQKEPLVTTSADSKIINNTEKNEERPFFGNDILKKSPLLLRGFHQDKPKGSHEKLEASRTPHLGKRKSNLMRKGKRRKHAGTICELNFLNSTSELVEPKANPKFANFSLQYVEKESFPEFSKSDFRFAGHQTLKEREASFLAHDQLLHCGFIKGSDGSNTGFELSQNDAKFLSTCQIAVSSCIFGNSDNLRTPPGKKVTRSSKKHVCFVMFVDEMTLKMMVSEGRQPDDKGYIGLWKVVVVRNLPYADMRRTGKVPKFLTHRLFPSARYSIWLDSKLRLQSDPLLILENFLWRKGFEYAISNHYDRHCVWEEVAQNKKLNKFNHTVIDEQFRFYQSDGLTKFNASDPNKLLPSYVPEGSFIVRAHTPMSNLFSCLWFNEVDRFTPRDQLSFAYTYLKLQRMNPEKHFYLNMFKDCERRQMAKLFHHRIDPLDGGMQPDH